MTTSIGIMPAIMLAAGSAWPLDISSPGIASRTQGGLDSIALVLASGPAAALSLTAGLPDEHSQASLHSPPATNGPH